MLTESLIIAVTFGIVFITAILIMAIAFKRPTPFQYTVFRIILAIAVAGIAAVIPGLINVSFGSSVTAGGALGVFVVVYFFSPARMVTDPATGVDLPALTKAWEGIRAPNPQDVNRDMAHRALNALNLVAWYWEQGTEADKRLIKDESFSAFQQWFSVLDTQDIMMSDGRGSRAHIDGRLRKAYGEMVNYA